MEDLGAHTHSLVERGRANGHDHELLEVHAVVCVRTAIEDIHHRHREHSGVAAAHIAIKLLASLQGGCLGSGEGDTKDSVGTHVAFVLGAVNLNHAGIDFSLLGHLHALDLLGQHVVHVLHSLEHALAHIAVLLSVAKLYSLVNARGGAGGHGCAPHGTSSGIYVNFHRGISTGIQDFSS